MPKMNGKPEKGINQPEITFDYEPFYPTQPPELQSEGSKTDDIELINQFENFDFESDSSSESSSESSSDAISQRFKRNTRYDFHARNEEFIEITEIDTVCPYETKKLYESARLSCSDLRNVNTEQSTFIFTLILHILLSIEFEQLFPVLWSSFSSLFENIQ